MAHSAEYAIVRLDAHSARGERLNVGLVIFNDSGVDVRVGRRLDKVKAISGALDVNLFRENVLAIEAVDAGLRADGIIEARERHDLIQQLGYASLSELAVFDYSTSHAYETAIGYLLDSVVEPEPTPVKTSKKRSRLLSVVKNSLRRERILGKVGDDLGNHQIIPEVKLAEGLVADLVLRNGAMHVVETVDGASEDVSPLKVVKDIGLSGLILEQARISFDGEETKARLIYEASATIEKIVTPSLLAVEHQGAELVNWSSADDRLRLLVRLSELAIPTDPPGRKGSSRLLTTTQHKLKLN